VDAGCILVAYFIALLGLDRFFRAAAIAARQVIISMVNISTTSVCRKFETQQQYARVSLVALASEE
jgi:hypothetical protein